MNKLTALVGVGLAGALMVSVTTPVLAADKNRGASAAAVAKTARFTQLPTSNYRLSAKFGQRGSYWSSGRHTGLDFAAPRGTKVKAVADGKVIFAGWGGAYGKAIIIKHKSGKRSLYAHLSKKKIKRGKQVKAGRTIGKVGGTGNVTGPHLHFEVRTTNGKKLNPREYLRGE